MPKRITWLINDITLVGGIERVVCNLSNFFTQNDCIVKITSLNTASGKPYFELNKQVKIEHLGYPAQQILDRKKLKATVKSFLETEDSDILITCHPWIAVPVLQNRKSYRGKIICTEHATWESHSKARRAMNVLYYRRADRLTLLTEHTKAIYKKFGVKNTTVIPNIIPSFPTQAAKLQSHELIAAGRLTEIKGFDRLIEAINLIKDQFSSWHLTIYGDGEDKAKLQQLINEHRLQDLVTIADFTDKLQAKLQACSGFVVSSHSEAFPMVVLEALSNGVPVISFDIPSLREIDQGRANIIFAEQDNVADLAVKISNYIQSTDRKERGAKAREIAESYSADKIVPLWIRLFNSL